MSDDLFIDDDDFMDDDDLSQERSSSSRPFFLTAGFLVALIIVGILCIFAVNSFRSEDGVLASLFGTGNNGDPNATATDSPEIAARKTENAEIAAANALVTQTLIAMATEDAMPTETSTPQPTNTIQPSATPQPTNTLVVSTGGEEGEEDEEGEEELEPSPTVGLLVTPSSTEGGSSGGTSGGSSGGTAGNTAGGATGGTLPQTGFGLFGIVTTALGLLGLGAIARRLRK